MLATLRPIENERGPSRGFVASLFLVVSVLIGFQAWIFHAGPLA